jgi:HlyD family type I secretion membrane fusion protein
MAKAKKTSAKSNEIDMSIAHEKGLGIGKRVIAGSLAALLLIGGFGVWAATSELSGAVIGQGQVMVDKDIRAVQHLDGGILRSINVQKGDEVKEGQVLFTLDDTQMKSEVQIIKGQLLELIAKRQRLQAERDGNSEMILPTDQPDLDLANAAVFAGEQRLFSGNVQNRLSQVKQLKFAASQADQEVSALNAQIKANGIDMALVQKEYDKFVGLQKKGLIDNSRVVNAERDLNKLKADKEQVLAGIIKSTAHRSEIDLQIKAVEETARTDAQKQLSDIEPRVTELLTRKAAIADRMTRMEIKSPIAGTINEVAVNTVGGVITPAQKLLTIVPQDAKLQIEVKVQPNDIDQIFVGQSAKLKFTAFSSRNTPEIYGKVAFVSPATSTDQQSGRVYYVTQVEVPTSELEKLGGKKMVPGMLVETFMQTESRTALSYLLKPFKDQLERAFRER